MLGQLACPRVRGRTLLQAYDRGFRTVQRRGVSPSARGGASRYIPFVADGRPHDGANRDGGNVKTLLDDYDRATLLERLKRAKADSPRQWGRMSPHGMICHLTDSFEACLGDKPTEDHSTLLLRTVGRFVSVTLPMRWPHGLPTLPDVDQEKNGTPPGVFEGDVARLVEVTEDFARRIDPSGMTHPALGRLTRAEWGRWGYRHVDHHLRQFSL